MNVQLNETEEFINGKSTGTLGQVLIRYVGNGVERTASAVEKTSDTTLHCCSSRTWLTRGLQMQQRAVDIGCEGRRDAQRREDGGMKSGKTLVICGRLCYSKEPKARTHDFVSSRYWMQPILGSCRDANMLRHLVTQMSSET